MESHKILKKSCSKPPIRVYDTWSSFFLVGPKLTEHLTPMILLLSKETSKLRRSTMSPCLGIRNRAQIQYLVGGAMQ